MSSLSRGEAFTQDEIDFLLGAPSDATQLRVWCHEILREVPFATLVPTESSLARLTNLTVFGRHPTECPLSVFSFLEYGLGNPPASSLEESLAWFLQRVDPKHDGIFVDCLDEIESGLGQRVSGLVPREPFGIILRMDDRSIQHLLREIQPRLLALTLKGAKDEAKHRIFSNMSKRASAMLLDDMDALGNVSPSEVQSARIEMTRIIARLHDSGIIIESGLHAE